MRLYTCPEVLGALGLDEKLQARLIYHRVIPVDPGAEWGGVFGGKLGTTGARLFSPLGVLRLYFNVYLYQVGLDPTRIVQIDTQLFGSWSPAAFIERRKGEAFLERRYIMLHFDHPRENLGSDSYHFIPDAEIEVHGENEKLTDLPHCTFVLPVRYLIGILRLAFARAGLGIFELE